jgi:SAM-dependent methyltransferase
MSVTVQRLDNLWWENRLRVSTRGVAAVDHPDAVFYATPPYRLVRRVVRRLALTPADVFVDIGCGKGRVLCCAARHELAGAVGVEVSPDLCAAARRNADRMRGRRTAVTVHHGPAEEFDYANGTAFFLFNPFGAATLRRVLDRIRDQTAGRAVRFAYVVPTHEATFHDRPWLEAYEPPGRPDPGVAFFRTRTS